MALKPLMAVVIRPWRHAGPHPPVSADRARSVPRPRAPAMPRTPPRTPAMPRTPRMLWLINQSNHIHEASFVLVKYPSGINEKGRDQIRKVRPPSLTSEAAKVSQAKSFTSQEFHKQ